MNCLHLNVRAARPEAPIVTDAERRRDARRAIVMSRESLSRLIPFEDWLRMKHRSQWDIRMYHTVTTELLVNLDHAHAQLLAEQFRMKASDGKASH